MSVKIGIVEDNPEISSNWRQLFSLNDDYECVGAFPTGEEALRKLPGLKPDVVLMDISLPGMSGIECVASLKRVLPKTPVLMITVHSDNDRLFQALQSGANGYLLKRTTPEELINAIQEVLNGGAPMTGEIARRVIESFNRPSAAPAEENNLSQRESEVIELLAQGYSDKEIAANLNIGFTTVRSHVSRIFEKLHVRSRVEAATKFVNAGKSLTHH
jgi:DNA-binding NarL/FixJ family response regulator